MPAPTSVLEELRTEDGTLYQLTYSPGSLAPWRLVIDGVQERSYDSFSDAMYDWRALVRELSEGNA
ncbi:MAG: hypothetical protein U0822_17315 [Anaerolineae bacterium]